MGKYDQFLVGLTPPPQSSAVTGSGKYDRFLAGIPSQASDPRSQPDNARLQDFADKISGVMSKIDNPGGAPNANLMEFGGGGQGLADKAANALNDKFRKMGANPYLGAILPTAVAILGNPENVVPEGEASIAPPGAEESALKATRKAGGFTKRFLNKPGAMEKANQSARTMLDNKVLSSDPDEMLGNVEALNAKSGAAVGDTVKTLSDQGVDGDVRPIMREVNSQLRSDKTGGLYDKQNAVADEIQQTIAAHGAKPSLASLQDLKQKLAEEAKFNRVSDGGKAAMYQRAYGIVNKAIEDAIDNASIAPPSVPKVSPSEPLALPSPKPPETILGPKGVATDASIPGVVNYEFKAAGEDPQYVAESGPLSRPGNQTERFRRPKGKLSSEVPESQPSPEQAPPPPPKGPFLSAEDVQNYLRAKKVYGDTELAEKALTNRLSSEEGNNRFSLTDWVAAAGKDPLTGAGQMLIKKGFDRYGNVFVARTMDYLAKNANLSQQARQAAQAAVIKAINSPSSSDQ